MSTQMTGPSSSRPPSVPRLNFSKRNFHVVSGPPTVLPELRVHREFMKKLGDLGELPARDQADWTKTTAARRIDNMASIISAYVIYGDHYRRLGAEEEAAQEQLCKGARIIEPSSFRPKWINDKMSEPERSAPYKPSQHYLEGLAAEDLDLGRVPVRIQKKLAKQEAAARQQAKEAAEKAALAAGEDKGEQEGSDSIHLWTAAVTDDKRSDSGGSKTRRKPKDGSLPSISKPLEKLAYDLSFDVATHKRTRKSPARLAIEEKLRNSIATKRKNKSWLLPIPTLAHHRNVSRKDVPLESKSPTFTQTRKQRLPFTQMHADGSQSERAISGSFGIMRAAQRNAEASKATHAKNDGYERRSSVSTSRLPTPGSNTPPEDTLKPADELYPSPPPSRERQHRALPPLQTPSAAGNKTASHAPTTSVDQEMINSRRRDKRSVPVLGFPDLLMGSF